ncbi:MAG TPA: 2-oxo-4-hydroxy-4-carboxy-5-ureidoimidazoline decarboxylase [Kiritimatiellia bacterium]|nr:2-oxo-4-hydroxy-4-carboxy-5-ureidoimidazoline decarboxylase [Kiritimatiellia bacterium]
MNIAELNNLDVRDVEEHFLRCCGCREWARKMAEGRPYQSVDAVCAAADRTWDALSQDNWLEAYTAHPRIGDINSLRKKFANTKEWASGEQSGVQSATDQVIQALADGNNAYEKKFGFIFIVCATGKSADEMLSLLTVRLNNNRDQEIANAGEEQKKITRIRIDKWLKD